jgi:CheY-like chemotaxis protein
VLHAMQALLEGWRCEVLAARTVEEAECLARDGNPDLLLLDFHLDGAATGLDLRAVLARDFDGPAIVITADHGEAVRLAVAEAGCHLLYKPLKPLALKSLMARLVPARRATARGSGH